MKKYFFSSKRKNLSPFCTDVPIRSHCSSHSTSRCCKKQRNHETNENIGIGIKQAKSFTDTNIQSKQSIINCSKLIQINFSFSDLARCVLVTLGRILLTSALFLSFVVFRTVSKVRKKGCFGNKFCTFLHTLKIIIVISRLLIFSPTI